MPTNRFNEAFTPCVEMFSAAAMRSKLAPFFTAREIILCS